MVPSGLHQGNNHCSRLQHEHLRKEVQECLWCWKSGETPYAEKENTYDASYNAGLHLAPRCSRWARAAPCSLPSLNVLACSRSAINLGGEGGIQRGAEPCDASSSSWNAALIWERRSLESAAQRPRQYPSEARRESNSGWRRRLLRAKAHASGAARSKLREVHWSYRRPSLCIPDEDLEESARTPFAATSLSLGDNPPPLLLVGLSRVNQPGLQPVQDGFR